MNFWKLFLIGVTSVGFLQACSPVEKASTTGSSDQGSTSPEGAGSPLYLVLESKYESGTATTSEGTCLIDPADPVGTHLDCEIQIPELRLHYSDINFKVGVADSTTCAVVTFDPYVFVRSSSATFNSPEATTDVDCSALDKAECFGGSAKSILTNAGFSYPLAGGFGGAYFLPTNTLETTYTATSSNKLALEIGADPGYLTNAYIANNLAAAARAGAYTGHGVYYEGSGEYRDYEIACQDIYGEDVYTITLTISDKDTTTAEGTSDQFYDWN